MVYAVRVRSYGEARKAEFFRREGARIGTGTRLLVHSLGSEPYLVSIGDDTLVSTDVLFVTHDGATWVGRDREPRLNVFGPIEIGSRCFVGARSVLLPGTKLGDRCIVGAGAVVKGEFPAGSVIAGVPAREVGTTEEFLDRARSASLDVDFTDRAELRRVLESRFLPDQPDGGGESVGR